MSVCLSICQYVCMYVCVREDTRKPSEKTTKYIWKDTPKNTQNTQINLNKSKLGEPYVYLKPVEQTLYSAAVPIKKKYIYIYVYLERHAKKQTYRILVHACRVRYTLRKGIC